MVYFCGGEVEERKDLKRFTMATAPERSRNLHNFSLPWLKWGGQRHLRCVRVYDEDDADQSSKPHHDSGEPPRKPLETEMKRGNGIEAVRKNLMLNLETEMNMMKFAVLSRGSEEIEAAPPPTEAPPWNLRTRRAVCKEPYAKCGGKIQKVNESSFGFSPADVAGIERRRANFAVPLHKQEIEEDFIAITGTRLPRRPKKRPRSVQKQMDTLFPGLRLSEITADMYKVNENP